MEVYKTIKYLLSTEKAVRLMEADNKLVFVVDNKAEKGQIKKAIEDEFKIRVTKINTVVDIKGRKKAYVKLSPEKNAIDIATEFGVM